MMKARTPYFHWGQSTTFKALAHLLTRLESSKSVLSTQVKEAR
jgi:hypothetical protein